MGGLIGWLTVELVGYEKEKIVLTTRPDPNGTVSDKPGPVHEGPGAEIAGDAFAIRVTTCPSDGRRIGVELSLLGGQGGLRGPIFWPPLLTLLHLAVRPSRVVIGITSQPGGRLLRQCVRGGPGAPERGLA